MIFSSSCLIGSPPAFSVSADILSIPHALLFFRDWIAVSTSTTEKGSLTASAGGGSGIDCSTLLSLGNCVFRVLTAVISN